MVERVKPDGPVGLYSNLTNRDLKSEQRAPTCDRDPFGLDLVPGHLALEHALSVGLWKLLTDTASENPDLRKKELISILIEHQLRLRL